MTQHNNKFIYCEGYGESIAMSFVASASSPRENDFCLPAPAFELSPFFSVTGGLAQALYRWLAEEATTLAKLYISVSARFGKLLTGWRRTVARRFASSTRFARSIQKANIVCLRL